MTGMRSQTSTHFPSQQDPPPAIREVLDILAARGPDQGGNMSAIDWDSDALLAEGRACG